MLDFITMSFRVRIYYKMKMTHPVVLNIKPHYCTFCLQGTCRMYSKKCCTQYSNRDYMIVYYTSTIISLNTSKVQYFVSICFNYVSSTVNN